MKYVQFVILLGLSLSALTIAEDARILMDCYINGQPVKFAFDTGAEVPVLFRQAADRFQLSIQEPPAEIQVDPGTVKIGLTEKCKFQLSQEGVENTVQFGVVDIPSYLDSDFDGFLGWGALKNMMIEMDSSSRRVKIRDNINFDKSQWECLDILKDANILIVKTSNEDATQDLLLIDTGDPKGLIVKKELLQQVKEDDTNTTLSAMYYPSMGLVVDKEKWVNEVRFGNLTFREVPVKMGMESYQALMEVGIDGILGMWGLSCYQWIIDGPEGKIYIKPNDLIRIPEMYGYNRLGAVFVPEDIQTGDALIAHVIEGGPGWRAGIRDGDELLRIGQLDATKWRTDPDVMPLGQFWSKPAGTVIDLVLLLKGEKRNIAVRLEEIFKQK